MSAAAGRSAWSRRGSHRTVLPHLEANGNENSEGMEMIARTWHGVVPADKADAYFAYLQRTGVPDLRGTVGNRGVYVLRRIQDGQAHFLLMSLWEYFYSP